MKLRSIFAWVCLFALAGGSTALQATCFANFQGSCTWTGTPADCSFSANRPTSNPSVCSGSSIRSYSWDFGDGSSSSPNSPIPSHTYSAPGSTGTYLVTMTIFCNDNSNCSASRFTCFTIGSPGCIQPNIGWN